MGNVCSSGLATGSNRKYQPVIAQLEREYPWARKRWLLAQVEEADGDLETARLSIQQTLVSFGGDQSASLKFPDAGTYPTSGRGAAMAGPLTPANLGTKLGAKPRQGPAAAVTPRSPSPSSTPTGQRSSPVTSPSAERVVTTIFRWNAEHATRDAADSDSLRSRARMRLLEGIQKARLALDSVAAEQSDPMDVVEDNSSNPVLLRARNEIGMRPHSKVAGALSSQRRRRSTSVRRRVHADIDRREQSRGPVSSLLGSESTRDARTNRPIRLILDWTTLPIATSVCRLHQLQQYGIAAVEIISQRKQPDSHCLGESTDATSIVGMHGGAAIDDATEIYFLTSSLPSLEAIALRFQPSTHSEAHEPPDWPYCAVLVSGHLSDSDLERFRRRIERTALLSRLGCFMEINLDYVAVESGLFHCNHPNALVDLFPASRSRNERLRRETCLAHEAQQLASVCETLAGVANGHAWSGSIYFIRGAGTEEPSTRPPGGENHDTGGSISEQLAQLLAHELRGRGLEDTSASTMTRETDATVSSPMSALPSRLSELSDGSRIRPAPVDVLILDRTVDLATLFIHDFHYGAMAMDLCEASVCACARFRVPLAEIDLVWDPAEPVASVEVDLDEDMDMIWRELRHRHIADTVDALSATFDAFLQAQPNVAAALRQRTMLAVHTGSGQRPEWYDIPRARASCPSLKNELDTFLAHFVLIEVLLTRFSDWALDRVAAMEQDLACCRTSRGRRFRHALARVLAIVENPNTLAIDKLRIALLYLVTQDIGTGELERLLESLRKVMVPTTFSTERLVDATSTDGSTSSGHVRADTVLQTAWNHLNVALGMEMRKSRAERRERRERSRSRSRSRTRRDSWSNLSAYGAGDDAGVEEASDDFELCRYNNRLAVILRQFAENVFQPECAYPLAADLQNGSSIKQISPVTPRSAARVGPAPSPLFPPTEASETGNGDGACSATTSGRTLVVYIAGGIMPSEARDVYRFAQRTGRSAVAGGSCILTPRQVLALLCQRGAAT
ncbi:hypothetical protein CCYA_CCYA17G4280 [Cyanidiococcus yangmingshanensis]|nr:hypothetical protein CCYA_CCYA17G4280 [Cyanidiococcus yangmingshanensis]